MLIYLLTACDRLEDDQERKLINNLPQIQAALEAYAQEQDLAGLKIINSCSDERCEDWRLGLEQPIKKAKQLQTPINFCNQLASEFQLDFEIGYIEEENYEAVSYFGAEEGQGDSFMIAQYLGL